MTKINKNEELRDHLYCHPQVNANALHATVARSLKLWPKEKIQGIQSKRTIARSVTSMSHAGPSTDYCGLHRTNVDVYPS